jgi:hypothetical protein
VEHGHRPILHLTHTAIGQNASVHHQLVPAAYPDAHMGTGFVATF